VVRENYVIEDQVVANHDIQDCRDSSFAEAGEWCWSSAIEPEVRGYFGLLG